MHEKARGRPGEVLVSAAVALHPYEVMLQSTAAQVLPELVNDEARQRRIALAQVLEVCVAACLDQRLQRRLLVAMPAIDMPAIEMLIADARRLRPGAQVVRNDHARQSDQATQAREADNGSSRCARLAL